MACRFGRRGAHRHVVGDHCQLGFQVDAPGFVGQADRAVWRNECIGAALIHQRVVPERLRHLGATRLAHQFDMIDVGAAVGPVVRTRQRAVAGPLIKGKGALLQAVVEALIDRFELGPGHGPVVQRSLQGESDLRHNYGTGQIAGNDDQHAIAALVQ